MSSKQAMPRSARFDLSTACQLSCPSCPTASGEIGKQLGNGFATAESVEQFILHNPSIAHLELSNWGEVLLNPEFEAITAMARSHNVALTIGNGVNLNTVRDSTLEALVRDRVRLVTCSIDGASQPTYSQYRRGGNFERVIENVRTINTYKEKYKTQFPILLWQFVLFEHNKHELTTARAMAKDLNMEFFVKLSWDTTIAPSEISTNKSNYENESGKAYLQDYICRQLFSSPQINHDGRLLGCCINSWSDFGNVLSTPLAELWNGERLRHARDMVQGLAPERPDIPCSSCEIYRTMRHHRSYLGRRQCRDPLPVRVGLRMGRWGIGLANRFGLADQWMSWAVRSVIRSLPSPPDLQGR